MKSKKHKPKQRHYDVHAKDADHIFSGPSIDTSNLKKRNGNGSIVDNNIKKRNKKKHGENEENKEAENCKCGCGMDKAFPSWTPLGVMLLTLAIRVDHVSRKSNWWILHPDEVFQSVEVAFSEVYGYGFRPYEYLPPPANITSSADEQEVENGMYSLRSLLFPRVFMIVFHMAKWIGIGESPFLISKVFHVSVTSLLPVAVYRFVRQSHGCHSLSSVACIFSAFSLHLTVLGTHTLVNSFLSPFFFFALSPLASLLVTRQNKRNRQENDFANDSFNQKEFKADTDSFHKDEDVRTQNLERDHIANIRNGLVKRFYLFEKFLHYLEYFFCGFLLGVICYIRVDMCITLAVVCSSLILTFSTFLNILRYLEEVLVLGLGVLFGIVLGGYQDYLWYGVWFISPVQWLKFNAGNEMSSALYGLREAWVYVDEIFLEGFFVSVLYFVSSCVILFSFFRQEEKLSRDLKMTTSLILCSIVLFLVYSNVGHKEVRFLHDFIVLQILLVSSAVHMFLLKAGPSQIRKKSLITYCVLIMHVVNTLLQCPNHLNQAHERWVYKNDDVSADLNACIDFLGRNENVRGVLIDGSIYATGGFTLLRKDTPILIRIHNEYHEYSANSTALRYRHGLQHSSQLRVVSRLTDFIDITNVVYLRKVLLEKSEYNYIVIKHRNINFFAELGYKEKYKSGEFSVCERNISSKRELEYFRLGNKLPVGINATVLEYEGSWLFTSEVYEKAIERLERSLELEDNRIRPFQLLGLSYVRTNQWLKARETESRCFRRHGQEACKTPQRRLILRSEKR